TGVPIDLNKSRSYHLDHIVPKSRGGDDSLGNCQIACREANQAKGDLLVDEFLALCKKVIQHTEK
ncbi:MAG: HNH endonuclease domain-containing protein, partial [Methylophilaceae bacterium]